jgi:hypothetical protein
MDQDTNSSPISPTTASRPSKRGKAVSTQLEFMRRLITQPKAIIGIVILVIFFLMAIFAPLIAPEDPSHFVGRPNQPPSNGHIFGTTGQGQDVFSQMVWGARVSLFIGFSVGALTTLLGLVMGMIAGYLPGVIDGVHKCVLANPRLAAPDHPGVLSSSRYCYHHPGPHFHRLGLGGTCFPLPGIKPSGEGFCLCIRHQRREYRLHYFCRDPSKHALIGRLIVLWGSNLCDRFGCRSCLPGF